MLLMPLCLGLALASSSSLWANNGYVLSSRGALYKADRYEFVGKERGPASLGAVKAASPSPEGGFVYLSAVGAPSVKIWTPGHRAVRLGKLPFGFDRSDSWNIYAYKSGEVLLQSGTPAQGKALLYTRDHRWVTTNLDGELFGSVPNGSVPLKFFGASNGAVQTRKLDITGFSDPRQLGATHGGMARPMFIVSLQLGVDITATRPIPTDRSDLSAFTDGSNVVANSDSEHKVIAQFDLAGLNIDSLVVAKTGGGTPLLYGTDSAGIVQVKLPKS